MCQCPQRAGHHFYSTQKENTNESKSVSMPSTGGTPFLRQMRIHLCGRILIVSMPSTGGTPFLRHIGQEAWSFCECVSMPSTGGTPFLPFFVKEVVNGNTVLCQCPQRAGHHFYPNDTIEDCAISFTCQCPQRAGHHFYLKMASSSKTFNAVCQCPQRAGHHFFEIEDSMVNETWRCQCPQRAGHHFFKQIYKIIDVWVLIVSMPSTGGTPFLRILNLRTMIFRNCVNALNGRDTISTPLL